MNIRKIAAVYSIIIGIVIIGSWLFSIATNQVTEIEIAPLQISYHLIAEFLTAVLLLIGGFCLFTNRGWGFHVFLIAMGMLLYAVIISAGYFGHREGMLMVGMFTILQILTAIFIGLSFYKWKEFKAK